MKLIDKDNKDDPVHMGWDAAQSVLAAGTHEVAKSDGVRIEDQPAAQSPAPGTEPYDPSKTDAPQPPAKIAAPAPAPAAIPPKPAPR